MARSGLRERLAILGLGVSLALGIVAPVAAASGSQGTGSAIIYHKNRSFKIPVNIRPAERSRIQELQLWFSEDRGDTWKPSGRTKPDKPSFTFRATRDAEYWFAVRMIDTAGRLTPGEDEEVQPSLKVIVDTKPPSVVLEPDSRRGSQAGVRWEVHDENLDLRTLTLEYQAQGAPEWRRARIRRVALIGAESWDAGTAEALRVRASVEDKAGNVGEAIITLSEGTPKNPALSERDVPAFSTPPVSQITAAPDFPPVEDAAPRGSGRPGPAQAPPVAAGPSDGFPPEADAFGGPPAAGAGMAPGGAGRPAAAGTSRTILVPNPKFSLQYAVDEAGPNGPAVVELWLTRDGGQTWIRLGEDPDRTSPFQVDLGGEGTFGLALVARAASGLGDQPPAFGDPPQLWVEVDNTSPNVQLDTPIVGTGPNLGKVAITWRASDLHLAKGPVTLLWRADQEGAQWQPIAQSLEGTGRYVWTVPPNIPPKFHVRVEAADTMGNKGSADTTGSGAIIVDRTKPRSRIIGLDPSAVNANGPQVKPLR